jgi:hypothetical protein
MAVLLPCTLALANPAGPIGEPALLDLRREMRGVFMLDI